MHCLFDLSKWNELDSKQASLDSFFSVSLLKALVDFVSELSELQNGKMIIVFHGFEFI